MIFHLHLSLAWVITQANELGRFGDLDTFFKHLVNQWVDFDSTYIDISLKQAKVQNSFLVTLTPLSRLQENVTISKDTIEINAWIFF